MPPTLEAAQSTHAASLIQSLQNVRRRVKMLGVTSGVGRLIATGVGLLVGVVVLDYLLNLPAVPRLVLMIGAFVCFAFAAYRWVVTPSRARLTLGDMAGHLENAFPRFDDRLRSTVNFLRAGGDMPGSDQMKARTIADAQKLASEVDLSQAIVTRPVWYSVGGAAGAVALLLAMLFLVHPEYLSIAASRLVHPFGGRAWPKSVQIELTRMPPARVTDGQRLDVQMRLAKGSARKATIFYRYSDSGAWQQELMTASADGTYVASLDAKLDAGQAAGKLQIKMQAGDDEALLTPVEVVPRLQIQSVQARLNPPAYAQAQSTTVNIAERPAVAMFGSDLKLRIDFNKTLDRGQSIALIPAKPEQKLPQIKWNFDGPRVAVGEFIAGDSMTFGIRAHDNDGFESTSGQQYELIVRQDSLPGVQIEEPRRSEERTPNAVFPLQAAVEDDWGISAAQLVLERASEKSAGPAPSSKWVMDLVTQGVAAGGATWSLGEGSGPERKHFKLGYQLDLSTLAGANLKVGDVLEFFVQVKDNFNLNGQQHDWVPSGKLRLTIISQAEWERIAQEQAERLGRELKEVQKTQARNRGETQQLADEVRQRGQFDQGERVTADRLTNQQATAASTTMQLAQRLQQLRDRMGENRSPDGGLRRTVNEVADRLRQTAEGEMKEAARQLGQAKEPQPGAQPNPGQDNPAETKERSDKSTTSPNADTNPQGDPRPDSPDAKADPSNESSPRGDEPKAETKAGESSPATSAQKGNPEAKSKQGSESGRTGESQAKQSPEGQSAKPGQDSKAQPGQPQGNSGQQEQQQPASSQKGEAAQRSQSLEKSAQEQSKAEQKLGEALNKLGDFSGLSDFKNQVESLKAEQERLGKQAADAARENLGKRPEDVSDAARKKAEELAKEQEALKNRTEQLLKNMASKAEKTARTSSTQSQAMKQASQAGQQVPQQQQKNAQAMRQNQQAQAQDAQKRIELGLELMLQNLRDAERRELEELARKLTELQGLIDELVRRQANHNLDNLTVRDPKLIDQMAEAERAGLLAKAARDPANPPPAPAAGELSPSQKTTERNTRDVAKKAEELSDPAPASRLTSAAGQMERAIVSLEQRKLAEAYEPPQLEALRNLEEAQALVDQAQQAAQKELEQQDQETIRQAYAKLLEEQKKLDGQTKEIHAAGEDLPRELAIRLGQMPATQGELVKKAEELGKQLDTLKSIVYAWANRDIIKSMNEVKESLAKPDIGDITQAEQTRIEEQLQAMVENLKQAAREQRFAERNAGNQGQGQQGQAGQKTPPMPSEPELRLLKGLQEAVNKSTKSMHDAIVKQADKDAAAKEKLLSLGGRQGELRNLLDELLKKASEGKLKLSPEPDNRDQLPEEAKAQDVEDQELDKELAGGEAGEGDQAERNIKLTGDRMARSRQRLAINNDPGKVTQVIQERIIMDIDGLIKLARAQAQRQQQQQQQPGQMARQQRPGQPNAGQQQANANQRQQSQTPANSTTPAARDVPKNVADKAADLSGQFKETGESWGGITARDRQAVLEGATDVPIEKYRALVKDYYRSISEKATER